ncbi:MAG TPA: AMP-binding protein [Caulobacteraceae bacterium]|nr:AMP-binding protein [Caulobacteraceae bacterium]
MIVNQIYRWAREQPGKTALICNHRRVDYATLARAIEATRVFLEGQALPASTVAAFVSPNMFDAWMFVMAARTLGLTTIVVETPAQAEALMLRNVSCLVAPQRQQVNLHTGDLAGVRRVVIPEEIYVGVNAGDPPRPLPERPLGGHILYTSGTTGAYKKLLVDGAAEDQRNAERARISGITGDTLFHALFFGLWTGVGFKTTSAVWRVGGGVVIDQTPERNANFLAYPITFTQTTPATLREILDARDLAAGPVEGLLLRCGGGFVPESLARAAVARISRNFLVGFSSTEMANSLMQSPFETTEDLVWLRPTGEDRVQVVHDDGVECPAGVEGLLRVRIGEGDSTGYLDDEWATAQFFRDGFFYPGDMAVRRADGRIRVLGRSADVINVNGVKYAVGPIEERLQRSLGVEEVCLFTGLSESGVEELVVAIQSKRDHDDAEVKQALGASSLFERIRVETFREFPRTTAGLAKTLRSELRRLVFERPATPLS